MKQAKVLSLMISVLAVLCMTGCTTGSVESNGLGQSNGSASEKVSIQVSVATADVLSKYSSMNEFDEFKDAGYQKIIFTTDTKVKNFKFIELGYTEDNAGIHYSEKSVLYSINQLSPEKPFVVTWMEVGDVVAYRGISFVDENNVTRYFYIKMSGKDGSLFLNEF